MSNLYLSLERGWGIFGGCWRCSIAECLPGYSKAQTPSPASQCRKEGRKEYKLVEFFSLTRSLNCFPSLISMDQSPGSTFSSLVQLVQSPSSFYYSCQLATRSSVLHRESWKLGVYSVWHPCITWLLCIRKTNQLLTGLLPGEVRSFWKYLNA